MTRPRKIGAAAALSSLPGWRAAEGGRDAIVRSFRFADFNAAFAFMTRAALLAQGAQAQPIPGQSPKEKARADQEKATAKETDAAYKARLNNIPDAKQPLDPWGQMRAPSEKKN